MGSGVDNLLMSSFGMNEMGNVDVEKYPKGIFSPSPKNEDPTLPVTGQSQKVSSPQKSISPHVVPHFQHPLAPQPGTQPIPRMSPIPQPPFQPPPPPPPHHHHMQRKVQLGPNFDRLGILNQANEIPPMSAPYFAKALQQHGGGTLGAILQAHQHALQQQMQRESFLLQQAVHQQMFQNVPFNIYHQQRMNSMMIDRRTTDDQIVPNSQMIPPPESWLKHSTRPSPSKRMKIKHEDSEITERRTCYKHGSQGNDKYVIFNDDNASGNQNSDDDDSSPPIAPPKDSVFVRYPTDSYKTLPSFSETFSGHIEKLKLKEQHLKDSLLRHGVNEHMIPEPYGNASLLHDNPLNQHILPEGVIGPQMLPTPCSREQILPQTNMSHHLQPDIGNGDTLIPISGMVDQFISDSSIPNTLLTQGNIKTETDDTSTKGVTQFDAVNNQLKELDTKVENDSKDSGLENKIDNIDNGLNFDNDPAADDPIKEELAQQPPNEDNQLDFLNLNSLDEKGTGKENDLLSETETDKSSETSKIIVNEKQIKNENDSIGVDRETENATNNINIFQSDLDLDTDNPNYDNLFNGNSDEHYFQAFKENNLHLMNDLNENKVDNGDDILKLLHSPLDFLNDKFLK